MSFCPSSYSKTVPLQAPLTQRHPGARDGPFRARGCPNWYKIHHVLPIMEQYNFSLGFRYDWQSILMQESCKKDPMSGPEYPHTPHLPRWQVQHHDFYIYTRVWINFHTVILSSRVNVAEDSTVNHNFVKGLTEFHFIPSISYNYMYTERQKKLITSSGRRPLKSTLSKLIIFAHK